MEAIARMASAGKPLPDICRIVGLPPERVQKLLQGGQHQEFDRIRHQEHDLMLRADLGHRHRVLEIIDRTGYPALEAGLAEDLPAQQRFDNAKELCNMVHPRADSRGAPGGVGVHIDAGGGGNTQISVVDLSKLEKEVFDVIPQLKRQLDKTDPEAHLLSGVEALPRPPGQLEVLDVEPLPEPADTDDSLDMSEVPDD